MSKPLAQRVTQLEGILATVVASAPNADEVRAALAQPAQADPRETVQLALTKLREARDLLVAANAPRAAERVRAALKSAEGAARNADYRSVRHTRAEQASTSS